MLLTILFYLFIVILGILGVGSLIILFFSIYLSELPKREQDQILENLGKKFNQFWS